MVDKIEQRLANAQWLGGATPGADDVKEYENLGGKCPAVTSYPRSFAWYILVNRFTPAVRSSWAGAAVSKAE